MSVTQRWRAERGDPWPPAGAGRGPPDGETGTYVELEEKLYSPDTIAPFFFFCAVRTSRSKHILAARQIPQFICLGVNLPQGKCFIAAIFS